MIFRFIFFLSMVKYTTNADVAVNEVRLDTSTVSSSSCGVLDDSKTSLTMRELDNLTNNATCGSNTASVDTNIHIDDDSYSEASYNDVRPPAPKTPKREDDFGDDFGVTQSIDMHHAQECKDKIRQAREYIDNEVMVDDKYKKIRSICKNKHESCTFWSILGECEKNPGYMTVNCAPACRSCEVRNKIQVV